MKDVLKKSLLTLVALSCFTTLFAATVITPKMSQNQIQQKLDKGGEIVFSPGTYRVRLVSVSKYVTYRKIGFRFTSNSTVTFKKGVKFVLEPSESIYYHILDLSGAKDVKLVGKVTIIGDAKKKKLDKGEWGHGIAFNGAKHVRVDSVVVSDCWGDGVRFGSLDDNRNPSNPLVEAPEDIEIKYIETSNNRRLGVGITNAKDIHLCKIIAVANNGTAPRAGIDIEPNFACELTEGIVIDTLITKHNYGGGLWVIPINCLYNKIDVRIGKCISIEDGINDRTSEGALRITSVARTKKLKGRVRINELNMFRPRKRGFYVNNWTDKDCEFSVGNFYCQDSQYDDILVIIDKKDINKCSNVVFDNVKVTNAQKRDTWMKIVSHRGADVTLKIGKISLGNNNVGDIDIAKTTKRPIVYVNKRNIL